jgi:hypothetical protein
VARSWNATSSTLAGVARPRLLASFVVRLERVGGRVELALLDLRDGEVSRWDEPSAAWRRLLRDVAEASDGPPAPAEADAST